MDDTTVAVLTALKTVLLFCEDQDAEVDQIRDNILDQDTMTKDDKMMLESLSGQGMAWMTVTNKVGNMINDTLFDALEDRE
jgi:hypothetical protein